MIWGCPTSQGRDGPGSKLLSLFLLLGFKSCLPSRKCSVNVCWMNDGARNLHGAFQHCFSDLARSSSHSASRSFQNWRLWLPGEGQAEGKDGMGGGRRTWGCYFSELNFHMARGELQGPVLFAGHRGAKERSGAVSSWPQGFKAGWGGKAGAPEN